MTNSPTLKAMCLILTLATTGLVNAAAIPATPATIPSPSDPQPSTANPRDPFNPVGLQFNSTTPELTPSKIQAVSPTLHAFLASLGFSDEAIAEAKDEAAIEQAQAPVIPAMWALIEALEKQGYFAAEVDLPPAPEPTVVTDPVEEEAEPTEADNEQANEEVEQETEDVAQPLSIKIDSDRNSGWRFIPRSVEELAEKVKEATEQIQKSQQEAKEASQPPFINLDSDRWRFIPKSEPTIDTTKQGEQDDEDMKQQISATADVVEMAEVPPYRVPIVAIPKASAKTNEDVNQPLSVNIDRFLHDVEDGLKFWDRSTVTGEWDLPRKDGEGDLFHPVNPFNTIHTADQTEEAERQVDARDKAGECDWKKPGTYVDCGKTVKDKWFDGE